MSTHPTSRPENQEPTVETTPNAADTHNDTSSAADTTSTADQTQFTAEPAASTAQPAASAAGQTQSTTTPSYEYPPTYVGSAPLAETKRRPRVETVVFGFIIIAVGIFMFLLSVGLRIDTELAMIFLLTLSGVALLGGALGAFRKSPR